jgi:hypothetical protein
MKTPISLEANHEFEAKTFGSYPAQAIYDRVFEAYEIVMARLQEAGGDELVEMFEIMMCMAMIAERYQHGSQTQIDMLMTAENMPKMAKIIYAVQ